ncbi:MAG: colanic acid biosynthesis glycosyltransferase WcaL [Deltaproteobacteria bacterium]|nr:MAG: colanic acid biosynthesis glycosyltransferase WcaL [Deltaproteobacteria bacterium]
MTNPAVLGMILKGYPRISETFISNEILLLERLGFTLHLFSMRQPRENFSHESINKIRAPVDYLPETLLTSLPRLLYHNLLLAGKRPANYITAFRTAVRRLWRTRKIATIKHLLQAGYLVHRFLPNSGVVHLHAHFAHSPSSVAMFASQLSGLDFSFTAHAKDIYTSNPRQLREKIEQARFVVTCTEYNKRFLTEISAGEATPIHRMYHGIDIDFFSRDILEKNGEEVPTPPYRILTIARMTAKKGLPTVYRALKILCDEGISFRHTLIGDGEDRERILSLIKELGLDPFTQLTGTQPHQVVLEHYRSTDVFVLGCEVAPNGDRDGIPNVLIESMAVGVPVVATNISAIPELVVEGETGLLVPPAQPEKMARALIQLLTDIPLRKHVIEAARKRVVQTFDNQALIGGLAAVYRQEVREFNNQ